MIVSAYRNIFYRDTRHLYILHARGISGLLQAAIKCMLEVCLMIARLIMVGINKHLIHTRP